MTRTVAYRLTTVLFAAALAASGVGEEWASAGFFFALTGAAASRRRGRAVDAGAGRGEREG